MGSGVEVRDGHHREGGTKRGDLVCGQHHVGGLQTSGFTVVAGEETSKVNLGRSEENLEMPGMKGQVR